MKQVSIAEAKVQLSQLIDQALNGEKVIITKAGKPTVTLTAVLPLHPVKLGGLKGKIHVPDDFDAPLPDDLLSAFEGRDT